MLYLPILGMHADYIINHCLVYIFCSYVWLLFKYNLTCVRVTFTLNSRQTDTYNIFSTILNGELYMQYINCLIHMKIFYIEKICENGQQRNGVPELQGLSIFQYTLNMYVL